MGILPKEGGNGGQNKARSGATEGGQVELRAVWGGGAMVIMSMLWRFHGPYGDDHTAYLHSKGMKKA